MYYISGLSLNLVDHYFSTLATDLKTQNYFMEMIAITKKKKFYHCHVFVQQIRCINEPLFNFPWSGDWSVGDQWLTSD